MRLTKRAIYKIGWKKHCDIIREFCSKIQLKPNYDKRIQSLSEIPSAKGLPIVGTLFSLLNAGGSENLHLYIDNRHKELGPIFKESIGPVDAVFVSDPQIMRKIYSKEGKYPVHILPEAWLLYNEKYGSKRGLYFMNGEEWLHYRRILNKVFLTNYNNSDFETVQNDVINQWINSWKPNINKDIDVLESQFYKLSLSYVVASLIGSNYINCKDEFVNLVDSLSRYVHSIFEESCKLNLVPAKLAAFLNLSPWKRFVIAVNSALNEGNEVVKKMVKVSGDDGLLRRLVNENVPEDVLRRIIVDLILAAGDTTAFTTQWSIYLLSRHKDVQESLREHPTDPLLLRGIIKETLRLYPAAPFITRILPNDVVLNGYHIASGELLIMSLYSSGRDERYFPQPDKFWPLRWERKEIKDDTDGVKNVNIAEHSGVIEPIASQPFAMGLRSCVGRKLAESQMMLTLTKIVENFRMESLDETKMVLHFVPVPKTPIRIHLSSVKS